MRLYVTTAEFRRLLITSLHLCLYSYFFKSSKLIISIDLILIKIFDH